MLLTVIRTCLAFSSCCILCGYIMLRVRTSNSVLVVLVFLLLLAVCNNPSNSNSIWATFYIFEIHFPHFYLAAQTLAPTGHMPHQMMWVTTTSAIVMDSILRKMEKQEMLMMIYGMVKDVAQAAVNGTTHLTSANTSTTPHMRTWKFDSSHIIIRPLCLS